MLFKKKIPCYVLVYDQLPIIKKTLDFLTNQSHQLDIIVIENKSKSTPKIRNLIRDYGRKKLIKRYYLFNNNVMGRAYETVFKLEQKKINRSSFVIFTDGDLVCPDSQWLKEELSILKKNRNVFACGVSLDMSNLPTKLYPEAKNWIPPDRSEKKDYYEVLTGCHLLMMRGKHLVNFLRWKKENKKLFVDSELHSYCYGVLGMEWARTKDAKAYHLTWDLYSLPDNQYRLSKPKKIKRKSWYQNRDTDFILEHF